MNYRVTHYFHFEDDSDWVVAEFADFEDAVAYVLSKGHEYCSQAWDGDNALYCQSDRFGDDSTYEIKKI